MQIINIKEKFELFHDHWTPKLIAELNGQAVKIAKVKGEFVWHNHKEEDELFYIIKGTLKIELKGKMLTLSEGDMTIIPRGVEHKPIADEEVWIMLFEPSSTKHTGEVEHELTKNSIEKI
jgi:mannose-6-phosphate isomerase-like protein (cupin superfamily)